MEIVTDLLASLLDRQTLALQCKRLRANRGNQLAFRGDERAISRWRRPTTRCSCGATFRADPREVTTRLSVSWGSRCPPSGRSRRSPRTGISRACNELPAKSAIKSFDWSPPLKRQPFGDYEISTTLGEQVRAFVPPRIQPLPDLQFSTGTKGALDRALLSLGRPDETRARGGPNEISKSLIRKRLKPPR